MTTLDADVCIIGAGPAGLTLASELIARGRSILLLESGGPVSDDGPQALNEGIVAGADNHAGLRTSRHRQAGGTTAIWNTPVGTETGAKFVPLDPADLRAWPIGWEALAPWFVRAQRICALGPFEYAGQAWASPGRPLIDLGAGPLTSAVYQFGSTSAMIAPLLASIRSAPGTTLRFHATARELRTSASGDRITGVTAVGEGGRLLEATARTYVLAGGAVENARLLLHARLGNATDQVGRCFMEHPRDQALALFPGPGVFARLGFYDRHRAADRTVIGGRLAPVPDLLAQAALPNFSVTLLPRPADGAATTWRRGWMGRVLNRIAPPPGAGYGWSRYREMPGAFEGFRLLINLEQRPHPDNRVMLGNGTDALGVRLAHLHWRWREEEQRELERVRSVVSGALEAAGLGTVRLVAAAAPDPNSHHHAGTTRMSRDPRDGVVDPSGRVHQLENLFVAGASVFPTAGFANPTLTIVALAARLAEHLAGAGSS